MNVAMENHTGVTVNPLLIVNTGNDGNTNSFITPTLATNCQNHQDKRNMVEFDNNIPEAEKRINARLIEIANQGPVKLQWPTAMTAQFLTDTNLQTMVNTNIRVHTQIKIDHTLTIKIDTTIVHGKATLTEPVTTAA